MQLPGSLAQSILQRKISQLIPARRGVKTEASALGWGLGWGDWERTAHRRRLAEVVPGLGTCAQGRAGDRAQGDRAAEHVRQGLVEDDKKLGVLRAWPWVPVAGRQLHATTKTFSTW